MNNKLWICSAVYLSMLVASSNRAARRGHALCTSILPVSVEVARYEIDHAKTWLAGVWNPDISGLYTRVLDREIGVNRAYVELDAGDRMLVGHYIGPELPKGTTTLPAGAELNWYLFRVFDSQA